MSNKPNKNLKLLYVEDDDEQRQLLSNMLTKRGYEVIQSSNPKEALSRLDSVYVDVVISDYRMPEMNGLEFLQEFRKINPVLPFIIITAYGDIDIAVKMMKIGATDFVSKPVHINELNDKLIKIKDELILQNDIKEIDDDNPDISLKGIIYNSERIRLIIAKIPRIAKFNFPVLISGESGTGKEIIANLIQSQSDRSDHPFIKVNSAAIPENLMESEFFGYEKGAFTGADKKTVGKIESANGGTIFLDEIGELPYQLQGKLLRFLQNNEIQRVGSSRTINVDVRVISATNKDLKDMVTDGNFREDLYFRLNVVNLHLPPLRERKEDIIPLAEHFIKKHSKINGIPPKKLSSMATDKLLRYHFPGNIRELENLIQNTLVFSRGEVIQQEDIPIMSGMDAGKSGLTLPDGAVSMKEYLEKIEKELIINSLKRNDMVRAKAAKDLDISESLLRYKIKKYGIENA
jgi:DNA-binding NtrC family response regulator